MKVSNKDHGCSQTRIQRSHLRGNARACASEDSLNTRGRTVNKEMEQLGFRTWREAELAADGRVEKNDQWPHFPREDTKKVMMKGKCVIEMAQLRPYLSTYAWIPNALLTSLQFDIEDPFFGQLTAFKTRYLLTSTTWPYRGRRLEFIEVKCFFFFFFLSWSLTRLWIFIGSWAQLFETSQKYWSSPFRLSLIYTLVKVWNSGVYIIFFCAHNLWNIK